MNQRHTDFQSVAQISQAPQEQALSESPAGTGARHGARSVQKPPSEKPPADPQLTSLIAAWPDLPAGVRAEILRLAGTAKERE